MEPLECIISRRSIRRFTQDPVEDATLERLLKAAMSAPSAGNQQSWRFVILRDRAVRERVAACSPYAGMLPSAAVGIAVCGETEGEKHPGYWVQDCAAAIENILVPACSMDLGAVWLGFHPNEERAQCLAEVLGLPASVIPLAELAIGHPAESKPPSERFEPSFVHTDRW